MDSTNYFKEHYKAGFNILIHFFGINATYKIKEEESIQRWFYLVPSFSPCLVRYYLNKLNVCDNNIVFDPFAGSFTTNLECQKLGIKNIGIDINPFLVTLAEKTIQTMQMELTKSNNFMKLLSDIHDYVLAFEKSSLEETLIKLNLSLPKISSVFRWWDENILKELLILKKYVSDYYSVDKDIHNVLWIALATSLLKLANVERVHPTLSFTNQHQNTYVPFDVFNDSIKKIIFDLENYNHSTQKVSKIYLSDSTSFEDIKFNKKVDFIITSPPYPNRYSYVLETRPHLYFFDFFNELQDATILDKKCIGGTWGGATYELFDMDILPTKDIEPLLNKLRNKLLKKDKTMANYVTQYFNKLYQHVETIVPHLSDNFQGVYIIGNSLIKGIEVKTEYILSQMFRKKGFNVKEITILRKRGGKDFLCESAIHIKR